MSHHAMSNLIALALAVIVALALSIPVFDAMDRAQRLIDLGISSPRDRLHPDGLGPVCGVMLFVLAAPVLIATASTLRGKLGAVLFATGAALALARITTLFEAGQTAAAWSLVAAAIVTVAAIVGLERQAVLRRQRHMEAMAQRIAVLIHEAAIVGSGAEGDGDQGTGLAPRAATPRMVRSMAMAVVWQATVSGRPETFERLVRRGLAELRRDLDRNRTLDPDGRGQRMLDRVLRRLTSASDLASADTRRRDRRDGGRAPLRARRRPIPRHGDHRTTAGRAARPGDQASDPKVPSTRVLV